MIVRLKIIVLNRPVMANKELVRNVALVVTGGHQFVVVMVRLILANVMHAGWGLM
jgi:hypothetical protein